ncbi:helix-turn-helix domain-containing protein [Chloroflexota bacterium]
MRQESREPEQVAEPQTVSVEVACRLLGISRGLGYALVNRGEFPVTVLRLGRRLIVPKAALERLLQGEGPQPVETSSQ